MKPVRGDVFRSGLKRAVEHVINVRMGFGASTSLAPSLINANAYTDRNDL
jgi:hypothetical protein